jgi:DNA-binding Lrp family transcriptional regulator
MQFALAGLPVEQGAMRTGESETAADIDAQLLALLRENSRRQVSSIASALGVSRATVYSRIARLEQEGIIEGYTVRIGLEHDRRLVRAHVMIKLIPKLTRETAAQLVAMRGVTALHSISGEFDMIAMIEGVNVGELDVVIDAIGMLDGVEKTNSSIILSTKFVR